MDQIKQLQTKYLVLMEKAQKATGWKESVKYFHGASKIADKIRLLSTWKWLWCSSTLNSARLTR